MPDRLLFPEFRAELAPTGYPFSAAATLANREGTSVPAGLFLDATLYPVGGREGAYLASVTVTHAAVTLAVGDAGDPARASGTFQVAAPPYEVPLYDRLGRPAGLLVSEPARLSALAAWGQGAHLFTAAQTEFAAGVCVPAPEAGLRGVLLDDGSLVSGELWLVGENGVVLSTASAYDPASGGHLVVVRVDCVGDPLSARKLCGAEGAFYAPRFVRKLRFTDARGRSVDVTPDEYGDVQVAANNTAAVDTVLRVRTTAGGLVVEAAGSKIGG